jgi:hypothetical protein
VLIRVFREHRHIGPLNFFCVPGLSLRMESGEPFGFTFLHIIGAVVIVGVAGISLINYLLG